MSSDSNNEFFIERIAKDYERIAASYETLVERVDSIHHIFDGKIDNVQVQVVALAKIVENGLSHRTKVTEENVRRLQDNVATKDELKKILADRQSADEAWEQARRSRRLMIWSGIVGPVVGALVGWGVPKLVEIIS